MKVCPTCGLKYPNENTTCFVDKTRLAEMRDDRIGKTLKGRYQIEGPLGEGGMAIVYRARNILVEQPVAVKVMNAHLAQDAALKERFRREAKNAERVAHPNIIDILDHGELEDGTPFLVMELLDGEPLNRLIERGPLPAARTTAIGVQIARGLARAHDFDVLHRDLKPENIFICRDATGTLAIPKLLDFGIGRSMHDTRLTNAGDVFGTPQYMAPERVTTIDAGPSADLYAVGVILFEMITGRLPFESKDMPGFFIKHLTEAPPAPSQLVPEIPRRLEELILALLEKKPADRPVDAHAIVKVLESLAPASAIPLASLHVTSPSRPVVVAPTLPPTTLERWAQRTALFDEILRRAHPSGDAPRVLVDSLGEIRGILARIHQLRGEGLKEQRKLELLEAQVRESRERLGHAVQALAEDLSRARESQRAAQREVQPYFDTQTNAKTSYENAHHAWLERGGGALLAIPSASVASGAREMADALDRWTLAHGAAEKAHAWVEARQRDVMDLEFQVNALRAQLERVETSYEDDREDAVDVLANNGVEVTSLEARLTELGASFVQPFQTRPDLGDLFRRLSAEGQPLAP